MPSTSAVKKRLNKRLLPLYLASFFQSFVLWYAIQRLFMQSIGFDDATIGLTIAISAAVMLLAETPAGILADRWSRKGSLILCCAFLAAASLIGGLSHDPIIYMISAALWGMASALHSGTYDSIIYDTVLEETGSSELYKHYYGRYIVLGSLGAVLGSLCSGMLAAIIEPRIVYFITVPIVLLAILFFVRLEEPSLHKKNPAISIKKHISLTTHAVLRNKSTASIIIVLILESSLIDLFFDFNQLWLIALAAPTFFFGLTTALLDTAGIIGSLSNRLQLHRIPIMCGILFVMIFSALGLIVLRNVVGIILCHFLLCIGLVGIAILFSHLSHDVFDSHIRSSASSTISMISRVLTISLSLVVGYISKQHSIFEASWLIFVLVLIMSLFVLKGLGFDSKKETTTAVPLVMPTQN